MTSFEIQYHFVESVDTINPLFDPKHTTTTIRRNTLFHRDFDILDS
jgi:hypothetical protein